MSDGFDPKIIKTDPSIFAARGSKSACHQAAEMTDRIKALIHEYDGIPLALALGVLRVVESELLDSHKGT